MKQAFLYLTRGDYSELIGTLAADGPNEQIVAAAQVRARFGLDEQTQYQMIVVSDGDPRAGKISTEYLDPPKEGSHGSTSGPQS